MGDFSVWIDNNRRWAAELEGTEPEFFRRLAAGQRPSAFWIGCSDSRVPPELLLGLRPGDLFVHRNVGNLVPAEDLNVLAALEYAVEHLRVSHVIVAGHYQCGAVAAVLRDESAPTALARWLAPLRAIRDEHRSWLDDLPPEAAWRRLCEINAARQALAVATSEPVRDAWTHGRPIEIHAWMFDPADGIVRDVGVTMRSPDDVERRRAKMFGGSAAKSRPPTAP